MRVGRRGGRGRRAGARGLGTGHGRPVEAARTPLLVEAREGVRIVSVNMVSEDIAAENVEGLIYVNMVTENIIAEIVEGLESVNTIA